MIIEVVVQDSTLMSSTGQRTWRRWLPLSIGLAALAGVVLWWASGFVLAYALERQLRNGGWPEARVEHASLALPNVVFDRVQLTAGETLVAENVRARVGSGIERIGIGSLRAEVAVTDDGEWVFPGAGSSDGDSVPLDMLPPDGIAVDRADIRIATSLGMIPVTLSDVTLGRVDDRAELSGRYALRLGASDASVGADSLSFAFEGRATAELEADRSVQVRLRVDEGEFAAAGIEVAGVAGDVTAAMPPGGSPTLEVAVDADAAQGAGIELGALAVAASWRDETVRFAVTTPRSDVADLSDVADVADVADLSIEGEAAIAGALVRGRVQIDGRGLAYPGILTGGALNLVAEVEASRDEVRVAMSEARAQLMPEPGAVPAAAQGVGSGALSVELKAQDDRPPTLRWTFAERSAELVGRLEASAGDARIATALRVEAGSDVKAELSGFTARNLPWGDLVLGVENFAGTFEHAADEWRIEGAGMITAVGEIASARVEAATVDWAGTITGTPRRIVLTVDDCVEWRVEAIELDGASVSDLAPLCVASGDDRVLLTHDLGEGRTELAFSIDEQPLALRLVIGGASYAVDGLWPSLAVSSETNEAGIASVSARLSGGALSSPEAGVALNGVAGSVELRDGAIASAALRVTRIESLATPAPIAPVGLELTAERAGDVLSFDAILSDDLGTFVLEAVGEHEGGRARADVRLHPVRFVSGATEVADLSPLLAEHVSDASGVVELTGDVEWSGSGLAASGTVSVRDFGALVAGIRVAGLGTETRLTSIVPPVTAPEQTVEVAQVDLGMPLEDGIAMFDLDAEGALAFRRVEFEFAGGRLYAEPFTIDSASLDDIRFVLRAEAVELSHFLELSQIEGLAGTGVLSGRVPVRLADGGIRLDEGVLAAETDGVLRYTPNDLPDFLRGDDVRSRMLREVLTNFQYEELSLAVSGESTEGGQQRLTLSARGANPDFLEGHPIELSFNFQGPLLGAVRSAVDLSDAAQLEQIFEQRETENEENSR